MAVKQSDILRELAVKQSGSSISGVLTERTDEFRNQVRREILPSDALQPGTFVAGNFGGLPKLSPSDYTIHLGGFEDFDLPPSQNVWRILLTTKEYNKVAITAVVAGSEVGDVRHHTPLSHHYLVDEFQDLFFFSSPSLEKKFADQILIFSDPKIDEDLWISPFDCINSQASKGAENEISLLAELPRSDINRVRSRLTDLLEYSQEQMGIRVMSPESVRAFRQFLQQHPAILSPTLFLTDSGALRAQWTKDASHALSILFQPSGIAEYVLFAPDRRRPTVTIDQAGSASWQSVVPSLSGLAILDWLFEI